MHQYLRVCTEGLLRALVSFRLQVLCLGLSIGAMVLAWCFQWTAWFGTSLPVISALTLAFLLGLELGWRPLTDHQPGKIAPRKALFCQVFLLLWSLGFPWFVEWQSQAIGAFSPTQLTTPGIALAVLFGLALVIVTPPVYALARLPFLLGASSPMEPHPKSQTTTVAWFVSGTVVGVLVSAFVLAPMFGLGAATIACGSVGLLILAAQLVRSSSVIEPPLDECQDSWSESHSAVVSSAFWQKHGRDLWTAVMLIALGAMVAWSFRVLDQLLATTITLACAKWAGLLLGWTVGLSWHARRLQSKPASSPGILASFFVGAWVVLIAAAFPWLIDLCLNLTVFVSNVTLLTFSRFLVVAGVLCPLGFVWGTFSAGAYQFECSKRESGSQSLPAIPLLVAAFFAGWLLGQWVLIPYVSMTINVIGFAVISFLLSGVRLFFERFCWGGWKSRTVMATFSLLMVFSFALASNYQPATSARLLFAAPVFSAKHAELDAELLPVLDEGRLVTTREGQQGTYTLWKYRGVQFQLRECGLPKGMVSGHPTMCPDFSAEVLPAALPLILHERPDSLLILGLGSGVSVTTALAFPTQEVTCVESDPALVEMVKEQIWTNETDNPTDDSRLTVLPIDPAIWVRSKTAAFDVIVSVPHQATLSENTAYFTKSFYREAAGKLTEDGLFCQRFTSIDFGPEPLRVVAQTMQSVFRDVVFLEMAGGEMLLIGSNSSKGVVREGFMDRLQREHVRRHLGHIGWDWSVPLNLTAYSNESLKKFAAQNSSWPSEASTSTTGTLAFRLPVEMMRWGPKPLENQNALAQHVGRFAQWGDIDPRDPDLLCRLAEVTGQRKLMATNPDKYWAYRKTVKNQITKRPRSIIVQVKGELPRQDIHPDEKRRLAYFRALGLTVKQHPHRLEDIARVEEFAEPYDPLLTFFLHQEVAELHTRAAKRNYAAELVHRFHSVYFAAPQDRSVRNITSAMEILCDHPEACPSPVERWDYLNGLLQMLKQRWAIRAGVTPSSTEIALNDVQKSLTAVNQAIKTMESQIRPEAGIDPAHWKARRRFLETTVVHPLRAYRRQLTPYHDRERTLKQKKEAIAEEG